MKEMTITQKITALNDFIWNRLGNDESDEFAGTLLELTGKTANEKEYAEIYDIYLADFVY